jgi:hypothetical protein
MSDQQRTGRWVAPHREKAAAARTVPGIWLHLGQYSSAENARVTAIRIASGGVKAYAPRGHFQAYRSLRDEQRRLWVRYVHGITPDPDLPEKLPEPVRLIVATHLEHGAHEHAVWAAELLAEHGHHEDAELVRRWLRDLRSHASNMRSRGAASFLLDHYTRQGATQ